MRKLIVVVGLMLFAFAAAQAQVDLALGAGTVSGKSASSAGPDFSPENIAGGTYLNFSGDFIFWHNLGAGGEVAWRATQDQYAGGIVPFRPIFYDFYGVFAPKLAKRIGVELKAGIGSESLHFYTGNYTCGNLGCSNYQSSNHFMGVFGGGIKLYATDNFFIRPEVEVYLVHNNFEFSGPRATRYGVSIGYTFGGK